MPSSDKSTPFCAWDEGCRVGIHKLDDQHKGLFSTLNKIYDILMSHGDSALVDKELLNLMRQTRVHFETEEKFMLKHGYPGYQMHKVMHELLLHQLEDVLTLESSSYEQPWVERLELADFLHAWLVSHILDEDKKIGAFLQINGAE
jgi:hemerythrin-like metal-binding protein